MMQLRCVVASGEPLPLSLAARWLQHGVAFLNPYGPSECTIHATCGAVTVSDDFVTIGSPMTNVRVLVLGAIDELLPPGCPGELHVGGVGLSEGYLKRPQQTAARFVTDPHGTGRVFKSGDLARWTEDGRILHMGRIDQMIKLRGQRIELGELEQAAMEEGMPPRPQSVTLWTIAALHLDPCACHCGPSLGAHCSQARSAPRWAGWCMWVASSTCCCTSAPSRLSPAHFWRT